MRRQSESWRVENENDGGKRAHSQAVELVIWVWTEKRVAAAQQTQEGLRLFSSFSASPPPASSPQTKCSDKWFTAEVIFTTSHTHTRTNTRLSSRLIAQWKGVIQVGNQRKREMRGWLRSSIQTSSSSMFLRGRSRGVKIGEACCCPCETTDPLTMVHFSEKGGLEEEEEEAGSELDLLWWCEELQTVPGQSSSDEG